MKPKGRNALTHGYSGKFGNQLQFKQYRGMTLLTALSYDTPEPTPARLACRRQFAEAVAFAKTVLRHPELAGILGIRPKRGQYLYHAAIRAYKRLKEEDPQALSAGLKQVRGRPTSS